VIIDPDTQAQMLALENERQALEAQKAALEADDPAKAAIGEQLSQIQKSLDGLVASVAREAIKTTLVDEQAVPPGKDDQEEASKLAQLGALDSRMVDQRHGESIQYASFIVDPPGQHSGMPAPLEPDVVSSLALGAAGLVSLANQIPLKEFVDGLKQQGAASDKAMENALAKPPSPDIQQHNDVFADVEALQKLAQEQAERRGAVKDHITLLQDAFDKRHANATPERKEELQAMLNEQLGKLQQEQADRQEAERQRLMEQHQRDGR
jgi:hypothetical protein